MYETNTHKQNDIEYSELELLELLLTSLYSTEIEMNLLN